MEDGSALTPLVANHLISGQNVHSNLPLSHSSQTSSLQHIRMLAKLVHCPLYSRSQTNHQQQQQHNSTQSGASSAQTNQQQQQPLLGFGSDETKNNALLFECLRHKPVEQIVQRIPLELLEQNQPTGDVSIAARFLKNSALQIDSSSLDSSLMSSFQSSDQYQQQQQSQRQLNSLDINQLKRLVMHITREQLNEERLAASAEVKLDENFGQLSKPFTAIYGPTTANMRPLFGPIIDGTIIPNSDGDDISINMLKPTSSFGQQDLMIGVSKPVFGRYSYSNSDQDNYGDDTKKLDLRTDYLIGDRISERLEQEGVSSEQAIELVNLFVRSFYRHHNQEIANSIMNHYLNNANQPLRKRVKFNLSSFSGKNKAASSGEDESETKLRLQQLALLEALLELFQDSLTNVPVLKTVLIHAAKQLDPLLDVFAGQLFEKWKQGRLEPGSTLNADINVSTNMSNSATIKYPTIKGELERGVLLESFARFAHQLFTNSDWPLKLYSPVNTLPVKQPKATYLYQLDVGLLIKEVMAALARLKLTEVDYKIGDVELNAPTMKSIADNLDGLLVKLQAGDFEHHLSLACAFETIDSKIEDKEEEEEEEEEKEQRDNDILNDLKSVVCSKLGNLIARFVSAGNLNSQQTDHEVDGDSIESSQVEASKYLYECYPLKTDGHHNLVKASSLSTITQVGLKLKQNCQTLLNKLSINYLSYKGNSDLNNSKSWTVFNLFNQQIASLLAPKTIWNMKEISEISSSGESYKQKLSLISKSSFWSNFIPALNCSKTQPIIPASLLATNSALPGPLLNSSLLSINLALSCQQGARTSIDVIDSLIANMEQQLDHMVEKWNLMQLSSSAKLNPSQNHHKLRMASMSQSGAGLLVEDQSQQDQQPSEQQQQQVDGQLKQQLNTNNISGFHSNNSLKSELVQVNVGNSVHKQDDFHVKYVGIVLAACSLVVSITLASGVFAVVRQRMKWSRSRLETAQQQVIFGDRQDDQVMDSQRSGHHHHQQQQQQETTLSMDESNEFQSNRSQIAIPGDVDSSPGANNYNKEFESYDIVNNNQCTEESDDRNFSPSTNTLVYFNGNASGNGTGNSRAISFCQSHSSLEVKNELSDGRTHLIQTIETSPNDQLNRSNHDSSNRAEPIMMPLLSNPLDRCRSATVERELNCLNGSVNEHYGGSSSETQNQSTSLVGSSKKRVKISDPIGISRRNKSNQTSTIRFNHDDRNNDQLQLTQSLYCPVHHHNLSSNQTLSIEPNLYLEDSLNSSGNIHVWNGSHIDLTDHRRLSTSQIESNFDRYMTQNVPLSSYFTTPTFDYNGQTYSNQQNMSSSVLDNNYNTSYATFNQMSNHLNQHFARSTHRNLE